MLPEIMRDEGKGRRHGRGGNVGEDGWKGGVMRRDRGRAGGDGKEGEMKSIR